MRKIRKILLSVLVVMFMIGAMNVVPTTNVNASTNTGISNSVIAPGDGGGYPSNPPYPGYTMGTWLCNTYDYNVEQLQYRLAYLGYSTYGYMTTGVDGYYGNITKNDVMNYQRWNGLTVDGICGPATWNSIFE